MVPEISLFYNTIQTDLLGEPSISTDEKAPKNLIGS